MTLVVLQVIMQSIGSTLQWFGFYVGIRALPGDKSRRWRWIVGSALVFAAWLIGVALLASAGFFPPRRIPVALTATLAVGYVVLISPTFRAVIAGIPQHWLIGIQTFRILGGVFLIRYFNDELPALFAVPAGVGDVLTGILAPLVAYWWFVGKPDGAERRDRLERVRHGRSDQRRRARSTDRRWRRRHRISDRAHPDLRGTTRVARPYLLAHRLAAQNIVAAAAKRVVALRHPACLEPAKAAA